MIPKAQPVVVSLIVLVCSVLLVQPCAGQQCSVQQTPPDQLGPFYVADSERTDRIGPENEVDDASLRLEVKGRVLSSLNCKGLANILVEVWYAGTPNQEAEYYQDDEYRGAVLTNSCGEYAFNQTFPNLYPTRPILHDHFRLSRASDGQELLVTQMYFNGNADGYVSNASRKLQAVDVVEKDDGTRLVHFDMYVDAEGDSDCGSEEEEENTDSPEDPDTSDAANSTQNDTSPEPNAASSVASVSNKMTSSYSGSPLLPAFLIACFVFNLAA